MFYRNFTFLTSLHYTIFTFNILYVPSLWTFYFAWTYGKSIYISVRLILSALAPERTKNSRYAQG